MIAVVGPHHYIFALADLGGVCPAHAPHLPGILGFDDILGHIV